jgi:hypothetical protein
MRVSLQRSAGNVQSVPNLRVEVSVFSRAPDKRHPLIVPNVLQKSILSSSARFKLLSGENRIVDFSPESSFELLHCFGEGVSFGGTDDQHVNVTRGVLLITCERPIEIGILYPFNFFDGLCNQRNRSDGFSNNATHFLEQRVRTVQTKVFLTPTHF